jgi:hypothetical protein
LLGCSCCPVHLALVDDQSQRGVRCLLPSPSFPTMRSLTTSAQATWIPPRPGRAHRRHGPLRPPATAPRSFPSRWPVVGELKRHLRDTSWRLHVPRPLKERALQLCKAADGLHQRLGRAPTTSELAEQLEMAEEEVLEGLAAASSRLEVSLDQPVDGDGDGCLGDLMPTPGAREEPEDLLALPDRGQGRMLPDAHLTVAASRPGPHARPAGRALNQRVVPPGRRPGVTCPAKPHRPSQPTRLPGVVGGPLPCLHVILGPIQRRGASGQPGLGRL